MITLAPAGTLIHRVPTPARPDDGRLVLSRSKTSRVALVPVRVSVLKLLSKATVAPVVVGRAPQELLSDVTVPSICAKSGNNGLLLGTCSRSETGQVVGVEGQTT
jgi:hypothetical protein